MSVTSRHPDLLLRERSSQFFPEAMAEGSCSESRRNEAGRSGDYPTSCMMTEILASCLGHGQVLLNRPGMLAREETWKGLPRRQMNR